MSIRDRLRSAEGFTETERSLASYLLAHANEIAASSITELAERSFTSNAAIIRLCRKLGMSGFREFRVEYAIESAASAGLSEDAAASESAAKHEGASAIMRGVASLSREAIDGCRSSINPEQLEQAAGLIRDAGNVYIFGVGDSLISSMAFANQLTHLGISCIVASQFGEDRANARGSSSDDVAILVSYSGVFFSEQARIMRMLRERGCRIVAITSRERLARDHGADCVIRVPGDGVHPTRIGTYFSQECTRYTLNCLYGIVASFDYEGNDIWKQWVEGQ